MRTTIVLMLEVIIFIMVCVLGLHLVEHQVHFDMPIIFQYPCCHQKAETDQDILTHFLYPSQWLIEQVPERNVRAYDKGQAQKKYGADNNHDDIDLIEQSAKPGEKLHKLLHPPLSRVHGPRTNQR